MNTKADVNTKIKTKFLKFTVVGILAVILVIAAIFVLWWKGLLLGSDVSFEESEGLYGGGYFKLSNRCLKLYSYDDNTDFNKVLVGDSEFDKSLVEIWSTEKDWFVQDVIIEDVDRDGREELVALVWKHGSFGEHKPFWVEKNDIRLEQHIYIFRWDDEKEHKIRNVWMSSTIGCNTVGIERYGNDKVMLKDKNGSQNVWYWEGFGLKLAGVAKSRQIIFACAGDNLIHEWMYKYGDSTNVSKKKRTDFAFDGYYSHIKDYISQADFRVVGQETVLTDDEAILSDYPRFASPGNIGRALENAGFNTILLANNHILDKGLKGVDSTYNILSAEDIMLLGVTPSDSYNDDFRNGIHFAVKNNITVAMLNYTESTNGMKQPESYDYMVERIDYTSRLLNQIRYARNRADAVIVFVHWGEEYLSEPSDMQRFYARFLANNEVDVIVGSHPHVLQSNETIEGLEGNKTIVYYSLGNFVSGQDKEETRLGGIAEFAIKADNSGNIEIEDRGITKTYMDNSKDDCAVYLYDEYMTDLEK